MLSQLIAHHNYEMVRVPSNYSAFWNQGLLFTMDQNPSECVRVFDRSSAYRGARVICNCADSYFGTDSCEGPVDSLFVKLPALVSLKAGLQTSGPQLTKSTIITSSFLTIVNNWSPINVSLDFTNPTETFVVSLPAVTTVFTNSSFVASVDIASGRKDTVLSEFPIDMNNAIITSLILTNTAPMPTGVSLSTSPPAVVGSPQTSGIYVFDINATEEFSQESRTVASVRMDVQDCGSNVCLNGGTCVDVGTAYDQSVSCTCAAGYGGLLCESSVIAITANSSSSTQLVTTVAGAVGGAALLIALLAAVLYRRQRRRLQVQKE